MSRGQSDRFLAGATLLAKLPILDVQQLGWRGKTEGRAGRNPHSSLDIFTGGCTYLRMTSNVGTAGFPIFFLWLLYFTCEVSDEGHALFVHGSLLAVPLH